MKEGWAHFVEYIFEFNIEINYLEYWTSTVEHLSLISFALVFLGGLFVDNAHHLSLDGLLLQSESILIPNEVRGFRVEPVLLHATLKQADDVSVIGVLRETKSSAVMHELSEFLRLVLAQFVDGGFLLLFLDSGVLLGFGSAGQALPWERALQEV